MEFCSKRKSQYYRHYKTVHLKIREFACDFCEKKFSRGEHKKRHILKNCKAAQEFIESGLAEMAGSLLQQTEVPSLETSQLVETPELIQQQLQQQEQTLQLLQLQIQEQEQRQQEGVLNELRAIAQEDHDM